MKRLILILLLGLLPMGCLWMSDAEATTIVALSDEELIDESGAIVHGTIVKTEPFYFDARTILTKVTLRVDEFLKVPEGTGEEAEFVFYTRGGAVGDVIQTVSGEFRAVEGDEVIVFLEKIKKFGGLWMVLGLKTGAYRIESGETRERNPMACGPVHMPKVPVREVRDRIRRRVHAQPMKEAE